MHVITWGRVPWVSVYSWNVPLRKIRKYSVPLSNWINKLDTIRNAGNHKHAFVSTSVMYHHACIRYITHTQCMSKWKNDFLEKYYLIFDNTASIIQDISTGYIIMGLYKIMLYDLSCFCQCICGKSFLHLFIKYL